MVDHSVTRALMPGPEARHPGDGTCPYPSPASGGGWTTAVALPCTIGQRDGFRPGTSHCVGAHTPSGVPSRLLGPEVPHPCAMRLHRGYRSALPLQARPTPHPGTGRPFQLPTAPRSSGSPPSMGSHRARWPVMAVVCATLPHYAIGHTPPLLGWGSKDTPSASATSLPSGASGPAHQCHSTRGTTAAEPCVMPSPGGLRSRS